MLLFATRVRLGLRCACTVLLVCSLLCLAHVYLPRVLACTSWQREAKGQWMPARCEEYVPATDFSGPSDTKKNLELSKASARVLMNLVTDV